MGLAHGVKRIFLVLKLSGQTSYAMEGVVAGSETEKRVPYAQASV